MANSISVKKSEFKAPLGASNSFTSWQISKGCKQTMELWLYDDKSASGFIEWDIPSKEMTEHIGLTFGVEFRDGRAVIVLTEYDGIFAIPSQAMDLLESVGIDCAEMRKAMKD